MTQNPNSEIKIKPIRFDVILETVAVLVCAATWGFLIFRFIWPDAYPDVFNPPQKMDLFIYAMTNIFFLVFFMQARSPREMNIKFPKMTEENAERQYRLHARYMRWLALIFVIYFSYSMVIRNLHHLIRFDHSDDMFFIFIIPLFIIAVYYFIRSWMLR